MRRAFASGKGGKREGARGIGLGGFIDEKMVGCYGIMIKEPMFFPFLKRKEKLDEKAIVLGTIYFPKPVSRFHDITGKNEIYIHIPLTNTIHPPLSHSLSLLFPLPPSPLPSNLTL